MVPGRGWDPHRKGRVTPTPVPFAESPDRCPPGRPQARRPQLPATIVLPTRRKALRSQYRGSQRHVRRASKAAGAGKGLERDKGQAIEGVAACPRQGGPTRGASHL